MHEVRKADLFYNVSYSKPKVAVSVEAVVAAVTGPIVKIAVVKILGILVLKVVVVVVVVVVVAVVAVVAKPAVAIRIIITPLYKLCKITLSLFKNTAAARWSTVP